jgi:AcrR family transcriptional regulator
VFILMDKSKSRHKGTPLRRREIIAAALACFSELGYERTGVSDIRERAGASTGSLYHHFGSKEQLAGEVYLEGIRDYQAGYLAALEKETNAEKGIHAIVDFHLKWVASNRQWAQYLFRMRHLEFMAQKEKEFDELNKAFFGRIAAWFRQQIEAGAIRRLPPELYPAILMGPCQEFAREYLAGHVGSDMGSAVKQLAAAVWRALGRGYEKG